MKVILVLSSIAIFTLNSISSASADEPREIAKFELTTRSGNLLRDASYFSETCHLYSDGKITFQTGPKKSENQTEPHQSDEREISTQYRRFYKLNPDRLSQLLKDLVNQKSSQPKNMHQDIMLTSIHSIALAEDSVKVSAFPPNESSELVLQETKFQGQQGYRLHWNDSKPSRTLIQYLTWSCLVNNEESHAQDTTKLNFFREWTGLIETARY